MYQAKGPDEKIKKKYIHMHIMNELNEICQTIKNILDTRWVASKIKLNMGIGQQYHVWNKSLE